MTTKTKATQLNFTAYIDGKAINKTFKANSMNSIWTQFNGWVKKQGNCQIVEGSQYLGQMAWFNFRGVVEIRETIG
jgi:HJR/Mrr/RecB family endonuclease